VLVSIIFSVKIGSKMVDEEVFWPAIFLAVLDGFLLGIAKWESLVTWNREEDPYTRSLDVGEGWLSEVVMQLSA